MAVEEVDEEGKFVRLRNKSSEVGPRAGARAAAGEGENPAGRDGVGTEGCPSTGCERLTAEPQNARDCLGVCGHRLFSLMGPWSGP